MSEITDACSIYAIPRIVRDNSATVSEAYIIIRARALLAFEIDFSLSLSFSLRLILRRRLHAHMLIPMGSGTIVARHKGQTYEKLIS